MPQEPQEAAPTTQDYSKQLRELTERREALSTRATKLELIHEQSEEAIKRIEEEMKTHGTSPEKIDDDLAKTDQELKTVLIEYKNHLDEYEAELNEAEEALAKEGTSA